MKFENGHTTIEHNYLLQLTQTEINEQGIIHIIF